MTKMIKTVKLTALLLSLSIYSSQLYAQSSASKFEDLKKPASTLEELKIDLKDTTLSASFRGNTLPVTTIAQLDAYLKNNPELALQMKAFIQSEGKIDPERSRSLSNVLNKNKIHNIRAINRQGPHK